MFARINKVLYLYFVYLYTYTHYVLYIYKIYILPLLQIPRDPKISIAQYKLKITCRRSPTVSVSL